MKKKKNQKNSFNEKRVDKAFHSFFVRRSYNGNQVMFRIFQVLFICCLLMTGTVILKRNMDSRIIVEQQKELIQEKKEVTKEFQLPVAGVATVLDRLKISDCSIAKFRMLEEYQSLYHKNPDLIGWLKIPDTLVDYPVMQTMKEEEYYLSRDFYRQKNNNGSLILDTDSNAGVGMKNNKYASENIPSTNLIIHGHTMKSGQMFGNLKLYEAETYGKEHNIIYFDSLYEERTYELIAVFYSQVYYKNQDVFKYYNFFQADTKEEFQYWYENIKTMSLYDTGISAEFGDEFITLSCCSYQVEDGRFVVVGKRIK